MGSINQLSILYIVLYALSLCLINPWGFERGDIWTEPKLFVVQTIITCNSWVILCCWRNQSSPVSSKWILGLGLWILFLFFGLISSLNSPFFWRSFWGQSTLGDGWIYWLILAVLVMSNALVLGLKPELLRAQVYGLLIGGVIVTFSIFPQLWDWRIDYTATSGIVSLSDPHMLESTVWQTHMPIGLYSNRGHTAIVLAQVAVLSLLGWRWGWIGVKTAIAIFILLGIGLYFTGLRGAGLAWLVAIAYMLWCCHPGVRQVIRRYGKFLAAGIGILIATALFSIKNLNSFTTGRLHLWQVSLQGIKERFWWGWGFDGFGIAFPFVGDWVQKHKGYLSDKVAVVEVLQIRDYTFKYLGIDDRIHTGILITNKAHNIILDTAISIGIVGLLFYGLLWWFSLRNTIKAPLLGIEAVPLAYLIYTLTWYESAQFSHIAWWACSIGLANRKNLISYLHLNKSNYEPDV